MIAYHDTEWGVPVHDDVRLFEMLTLEGAQAGLSWETILRKREGYRRAFLAFDPARVARITPARIERILTDPGIVRNRSKVASTVTNARALLDVQRECGSFDRYVWSFVGGKPVVHRPRTAAAIPAGIPATEALSADLKRRGFRFVGPTIVYAFAQAVGLVDDHLTSCFCKGPIPSRRRA